MSDEADAMWDAHMIEKGYESVNCSNQYGGQCNRWPSCACGNDTRKRPYDPCARKKRRAANPAIPKTESAERGK